MPKRTFQPHKRRRIRKLGFLAKNATKSGRRVLKRRLAKGRYRLTVSDEIRSNKKKRIPRIR